MDSSPTPNPSDSSRANRAAAPPFSLERSSSMGPSDSARLVDALRQALARGTSSIDSVLQATTDAARNQTGADGIALALRSGGAFVCRARSGDIAPDLGATFNLDSGISGECLRRAQVLVCNDANTDTRVDAAACRALSLRSMVVVPVHGTLRIAGVLEAFSNRPYAFGAEQIDCLKAFAEIAEAAYDREGLSQAPSTARVTPIVNQHSPLVPLGIVEVITKFYARNSRRRYWIPVAITATLLVISMVGWLGWREPSEIAASESAVPRVHASTESSPAAPHVAPPKPENGGSSRFSARVRSKNLLQNAADIEPSTGGPHSANSTTELAEATPPETSTRPATATPIDEPPSIEITSSNSSEVTGFSSAPAEMPSLAARVSTGMTEANLIRKVEPQYPPEARIQKLAGSVVLEATIADDGSVRDVKVVSGESLLAGAASAAVKQWRYSPSRLNGSPVSVQKRITIVFKLP